MSEYHRHEDGGVVVGPAAHCLVPNSGAEDVVILSRDEYDRLVEQGVM